MLGQLRALHVALLDKQLRPERAGGCRRIGAGCVLDDRISQVSLVSGLGIRVEYLSSQSIRYPIAEPADVDEHAFVSEIGQQAAAVGDSDAGVEGDRFPHPVNVGFGDAVVPEHGRSQIGSLDLEPSLTLGRGDVAQLTRQRGTDLTTTGSTTRPPTTDP